MEKLIVISAPEPPENEAAHLNALFAAGLSLFHLRRQRCTAEAQQALLAQIEPQFLSRISIHQHHAMADAFGLRYIHLPANMRHLADRYPRHLVSTSFHDVNEIRPGMSFHHAFLGPVADSISKPGYMARAFQLPSRLPFPLFAIGGVTPANAAQFLDQGFSGIAVVGSIWAQPENCVQNFINLRQTCSAHVY